MFDRFRAFTSRQQIVLVASAVGLSAAIIGLVWFFALRTVYRPLFTDVRPTDAATIVADLQRKKIDYRLANGGSTILVPEDLVDGTRLSVMSEDLPLRGTVGFELFNKSDLGLTDFAQKINYQRALQGELERTIMTLDGIDSARVHLSLGEDRIFRDDRVPPKASVTVRMRTHLQLRGESARGIQRLVAAAVPNLEVSDVVILDEKGDVIGAPAHIDPAKGEGAPIVEETEAVEQYYVAVVRQALERSYPGQDIDVAVTAGVALGKSDPGTSLPDWNPQARNFPVHVRLSSPVSLDAASQTSLRNLVMNATRSVPADNDTVDFDVRQASAEEAKSPVVPHLPDTQRPSLDLRTVGDDGAARGEWPAFAALFGVFILILIGSLAAARRMRRPKRLTEAERADFAARLRAQLDQVGAHAASRS